MIDLLDPDKALVADEKVSGLLGIQLNGWYAAMLLEQAGWVRADQLHEAVGTFFAESLLYTQAFHHNMDAQGNIVSTDWGPCQLNDKAHPQFFPGGDPAPVAFNPDECFKAATQIAAVGTPTYSLEAWYAWTNQVFLDDYYVARADLAVCNWLNRRAVEHAKARASVIAGRQTPPTRLPDVLITTRQLRTIYPVL